jgi:flagellar protein FlaG
MITDINKLPPVEKGNFSNLKTTGADSNGVITAPVQKIVFSNSDTTTVVNKKTSNKEEKKTSINNNSTTPNYNALADKIKNSLSDIGLNVQFKFDKNTNQMLVQIIDPDTKEVLQQFPPEIAVQLTQKVSKSIASGTIANAKV